MTLRTLAALLSVLWCAPLLAADRYVLPHGAGNRNGSSFAHAYDASRGGLQRCWNGIGPGDTCHVGPGLYKEALLIVRKGGLADKPRRLAGSAQERPVFQGDWKRSKPDVGRDFIVLQPGADYVEISRLEVRSYRYGIRTTKTGRVDHLRLSDINLRDVRIGVEIYGDRKCSNGPPGEKGCPEPQRASHDIRIDNVDVTGATKIGIRLRYGAFDAVLRDCDVDMGGRAYDKDPGGGRVGFSLGDGLSMKERSPDRNVTFIDCTARNAYNDLGENYWQGDGFKTENHSTGVRFIRCGSFDNTDGGFDVKGPGTVLENCIAARNKRNFRLWNPLRTEEGRARLVNCLGHHAKYWGDKHSVANLHLFGSAWIRRSTFHGTVDVPETVRGYSVLQQNHRIREGYTTRIEDSVVSFDPALSPGTTLMESGKSDNPNPFDMENTLVSSDGGPDAPDFVHADPSFEGGSDAFNSRRYGETKGWFWKPARGRAPDG